MTSRDEKKEMGVLLESDEKTKLTSRPENELNLKGWEGISEDN